MYKLLIIFAIALILAYCSQKEIFVIPFKEKKIDISLILLIIILSFFCGLRTSYNDTEVYIVTYQNAPTLSEYFANGVKLTSYPAYYGLQSFFRHHISSSANVYFLSIALFSTGSILTFIRKYSTNFVLSVLLFFSLGLYVSHFAAMKQCLAIAVLTYAIEALIKKRHWLFFLLIFVAMMFHTYAILFIILPFFTQKPWSFVTYAAIAVIMLTLLTFESTITGLLEYADDFGKNYTAEGVLEGESINPFRLAVFSVPPLLSFMLQEYAEDSYNRERDILMNLCILTCLIMCLGLGSAANLFARSSFYFEIGTIISFPWFLQQVFDKPTERFISLAAGACYTAFFIISNLDFGTQYRALGLLEFIKAVF